MPYEVPIYFPPVEDLGFHEHFQATAQMAADRGWFFHSNWYKRLVPDTRRCIRHGEIMFEELDLTEDEKNLGYRAQDAGYASGR